MARRQLRPPDAGELTNKEKKEQSAAEKFAFFNDTHTPAWFEDRHSLAQTFLDRFVRQNVAEIDEIPWGEQVVSIQLPAAERALYVELKNHLEALDMKNNHKTIKSKCKSENDREMRLAQVLVGSDSPEEALLKRCAHFDLQGKARTAIAACDAIIETRRKQLEMCKAEIVKQVAYTRDAITIFEKAHPDSKLNEKEKELRKSPAINMAKWKDVESKDCGDEEANAIMEPLIKEGEAKKHDPKVKIPAEEKVFKDKMCWTRDQVHLLRRLTKEVTGRVRSLRFFENVRKLQQEGGAADFVAEAMQHKSTSPKKVQVADPNDLALLSCCGHVGEAKTVQRHAADQLCFLHPACKAPARPSCVIPVKDLGMEGEDGSGGSGAYGVKLQAVIKLVKKLPKDERILIFIQFQDLLDQVEVALKNEKIPTARLAGTPNQRSTIIETFQQEVRKDNEPRVLILNLRDESAAGANLTAASHAIFVHPLLVGSQVEYTSCDTQAVGRIRRYGQHRKVQLYRFLVSNTIDEEIFKSRRADAEELLKTASKPETAGPL